MEVLRGLRPDTPAPDVVVVVVDASNLQRNLYLVSQLIELGRPMVVALNMTDVAERRGIRVSPEALAKELGVPVVPIVGHKRRGIDELKEAILKASRRAAAELAPARGDEGRAAAGRRGAGDPRQRRGRRTRGRAPEQLAPSRQPGDCDTRQAVPPRAWICAGDNTRHLDRYQAIAERLLIGDRAADVSGLRHAPARRDAPQRRDDPPPVARHRPDAGGHRGPLPLDRRRHPPRLVAAPSWRRCRRRRAGRRPPVRDARAAHPHRQGRRGPDPQGLGPADLRRDHGRPVRLDVLAGRPAHGRDRRRRRRAGRVGHRASMRRRPAQVADRPTASSPASARSSSSSRRSRCCSCSSRSWKTAATSPAPRS